jgi:CubicO group peptidase (beta-lactamase class C family)
MKGRSSLHRFVLVFGLLAATSVQAADYIPPLGDSWATHTPEQEGLDPARLKAAIDLAIASETIFPPELAKVADVRDLRIVIPLNFAKEPFSDPIGPLKPRAPANGVILRHGYIVAEWGDTRAVDMTFSVTKTFLSAVAGVAFDRHMIRDVNDRLVDYVQPTTDFMLPHNQPITWDQMLRQTSGWVGTMWGKPWWADRPGEQPWSDLVRGPPPVGELWEYNDVRVNALSLALTHLWQRPLPEVLKQYVMDPIDASHTWYWEGYDNSWITLNGKRVQVVPGGGHWGGGMFISARDLARIGLLALWNGNWGGKQILSDKWIALSKTPTGPNPGYGYMNWFLNTDQKMFPAARADAVAFVGNGTNMVFIDYEHDIVAVVRWVDDKQTAEFVRLLELAAQ